MLHEILILLTLLSFTSANCHGKNQTLDWWQKTVIYQVYPRSFQDTDGSGIGDINGIRSRLGHFIEAGINAVWLSPIYKSPQADFGYDISNYTEIDPIFGTIQDLKKLIQRIKSLGMKLILDFVPNHTSDQHIWFKNSIERKDPYTNYYVWKDPKGWLNKTTPIPPNNWQSVALPGSAWKFNPKRKQFYLHQFFEQQPDLNYRCPDVIKELKNVLRYYLDLKIDGFRVDAVPFLVEDVKFFDEPLINQSASKNITYNSLKHIYTKDQPETYEVLRQFREVLDGYTQQTGSTKILLTEGYTDIKHTLKYYGTETKPIAQIPFYLRFISNLNDSSTAIDFKYSIDLLLDNIPKYAWPNWQIDNHDNPRVPARFDARYVDGLNMMVLLLPGTAITYYGDEIGMEDTKILPNQTMDRSIPSRDPERTPFQWNDSPNAGFSNNRSGTWLPVNPNYHHLNLKQQKKNTKSHYNIYKRLVKLRSTPLFQYGDCKRYVISKWVFAFTRSLCPRETCVFVMNLSNEVQYVKLKDRISNLPKILTVEVASGNSKYNVGNPTRRFAVLSEINILKNNSSEQKSDT